MNLHVLVMNLRTKTDNLGLLGHQIYHVIAASADLVKKKNEFTTRLLRQLLEPLQWHSL